MRLTLLCVALTTLSSGALEAQSLPERIRQYVASLPASARVHVALEPLNETVDTLQNVTFLNADVAVPSASLIKIPILLEAAEQIRAGHLDLDEIHILVDGEKTAGAGVLKNYPNRSRVAYRDLLALMIQVSDNTATNILIDELGMDAINARLRLLGLPKSQLNRRMMDTVAVRQGRENYVTAREMNQLLRSIALQQVATPALCAEMLTWLKRNDDTLTIPAGLPANRSVGAVAVAHKSGILAYVRADAGIVYGPRPFVLTVLVQGLTTSDAERVIANVARLAWEEYK